MSVTAPHRPQSTAVRRTGYVVAVLVNLALLVGLNAWPGWDVVPFLTEETSQLLFVVNASIVVNLAVNAVYVVHDPPWLRSAGDLVTLGVGVLALVRIWQVFPFELWVDPFDWALVVRILLAVAMVGSAVGMLAALATLVRSGRTG